MTIYTNKKTGATYTNLTTLENGKFQLTATDSTDTITTTESVLKRWYKKEVVVDFTNAEEKPAEKTKKPSKKATAATKKTSKKPRAKTYEEQNWGLGHTRLSLATFCEMLNISEDEFYYNSSKQMVTADAGECKFSRRAWKNELTGSVWFRFKNYEYELTDVAYIEATQVA